MIHQNLRYTFLSLFLSLILSPLTFTEKAAAQITTNANDEGWSLRNSATSRGKVLWYDQTNTVFFHDGTSTDPVQDTTAAAGSIDNVVFTLGSGASADEVIGAWRRGTDDVWVWVNGGTPVKVSATNPINANAMNPEAVSVSDGCVFIRFRVPLTVGEANHVFKINPQTGAAINLTGNASVPGAARVSSSDCQAAWVFDDGAGTYHLQFYNGTNIITVDTADENSLSSNLRGFHLQHGRLVYEKVVNGIRQVFLYDSTNENPAPVQLTTDTDASFGNFSPRTDGRHVVWLHGNANGTDVHIIFNGGVQLTDTTNRPADLGITTEHPFQLHRGGLFWTDLGGSFRYHDGSGIATIDPAPSTSVVTQLGSPCCLPWLADGFVHWIGLSNDGGADSEVFRFTGTAPADAQQPVPPLLVTLAPGANQITINWDQILGADSYNLYISEQSGLTKENFATLRGGRKRSGVTGPYALTDLTPNRTYHFVITAVDGGTEGSGSREVATALINWASVGGLSGTSLFAVAADKTTDGTAYAAGGSNVYKTTDGGNTWTALAGGINGKDVRALAVDGDNVYASSRDIFVSSTPAKISKSTNGGTSWTEVLPNGGSPGESDKSLAIDPNNPNTLYAGNFEIPTLYDGGTDSLVIKSTNGGAHWDHLPNSTVQGAALGANAIVFDSAGVVYVGGSGTPNVAKSNNGGTTWTDIRIPGTSMFVYSLAVHPTNTSILYAGTSQGMHKSADGGTSWMKKNTGLPELPPAVRALLIDPANPDYIHAGTSEGYYYTLDGGGNWMEGNSGSLTDALTFYGLALTPSRDLIAATSNGLFLRDLSTEPTTSASSDLVLTHTATPNPVSTGENLTYQLTVANSGPEAATSVVVTMTLSAGTSLVSSTPQGACQGTDTVTCNLGVIDNGANVVVTIIVTPGVAGDLSQQAQVSTGSTDPNGANNSVSMNTTVSGASGGSGGDSGGSAEDGGGDGDGGSTGGSGGGGGGGGCTMKVGSDFDPTLVGLLGILSALLLRKAIRQGTKVGIFFLIGSALWFAPEVAHANTTDINNFNTKYGTTGTRLDACTLCHTSVPALNSYGTAYKAAGRTAQAFGTIESSDSDADFWTNIEEINARTFPGNAADKIIVTLTPSTDARFDRPGATVTFSLEIQNTGSATDTYTVTVTGNSWTSTAGSVGSLASSATANLTVTVQIPNTASAAESDTATIKITSQADSTKSTTATLTTTVFSASSLGEWISVGKLSGTTFHAVAAEKTDNKIAYAAGGSNLYKSTDGGNSWSVLAGGIAGQNIRTLAVDGQIIYGATPDGKLFKSVNGGDSWTDVLAPFAAQGLGEQVASIAVDPANSGTLYAGDFKLSGYDFMTDSLVIKSTDGGTNWVHLPNPPISGAELHAHAIAIDQMTLTIYAGGTGTPNLAKSTDGGTTSIDIPITGISVFVHSLAIDPKITSTIYAGTATQGIFKSVNSGGTFTPVNAGLPAVLPIIYALLIHPDDHNQIFAATSAGLYFSPDGGAHWVARSSGLTTASAQSIRAVAITPSLILIGATEDGLFILDLSSPTGGETGTGGSTGNDGDGGPVVGSDRPTGGSGGGGGGGCALGGNGAADATLGSLFSLALAVLAWRRIKKHP